MAARLILTRYQYNAARIRRTLRKVKRKTLEEYAALTATIAKRSQKPQPGRGTKNKRRRQLTRFGRHVTIQSGKRKGRQRFEKGMHSPPGKPPYYDRGYSGNINLRSIVWDIRGDTVDIYTRPSGRVRREGVIPIPILHEQGGTTKAKTRVRELEPGTGRYLGGHWKTVVYTYPKRAFMVPAGWKATSRLRRNLTENMKKNGAGYAAGKARVRKVA